MKVLCSLEAILQSTGWLPIPYLSSGSILRPFGRLGLARLKDSFLPIKDRTTELDPPLTFWEALENFIIILSGILDLKVKVFFLDRTHFSCQPSAFGLPAWRSDGPSCAVVVLVGDPQEVLPVVSLQLYASFWLKMSCLTYFIWGAWVYHGHMGASRVTYDRALISK